VLTDDQGEAPETLCLVPPVETCMVHRYSIETERDCLTSNGTPLRVASAISTPGRQLRTKEQSNAHDEQDPTPGVHPPDGRAQSLSGVPPNTGSASQSGTSGAPYEPCEDQDFRILRRRSVDGQI
jgi:hypothetical protein